MGVDWAAGLLRGDGHRLARLDLPRGDPAVGGGPLDDAGPDVRALDDGAHVVEAVDAFGDVGYEQVRDLGDRVLVDPALPPFQVDLLLVEARRLDDLQAGHAAGDFTQLEDVAPRGGGAHVDDGSAARPLLRGLDEIRRLLDRFVDVVEEMVGIDVDLPRADADEVVVGVDDSERLGRDVPVDGSYDRHRFFLSLLLRLVVMRRLYLRCAPPSTAAAAARCTPAPPPPARLRSQRRPVRLEAGLRRPYWRIDAPRVRSPGRRTSADRAMAVGRPFGRRTAGAVHPPTLPVGDTPDPATTSPVAQGRKCTYVLQHPEDIDK